MGGERTARRKGLAAAGEGAIMRGMKGGYPLVFRRSAVEILFRTAALLLALEVIGFGVLLQTYSSTAEEAALASKAEQARGLLEAQGKVELTVLLIGGALFLLLAARGAKGLLEARRPLVVERDGVTLPDGRRVEFGKVSAVVFRTEPGDEDLLLMEGLMVPVDDAPGSSVETVYFLPEGTDAGEVEDWREGLPEGAEALEKFHLFEDAERAAVETARAYAEAKKGGKVYSLLNKFRKQRVLFAAGRGETGSV